MDKQKTLIFSLSALLFLATSFIVYSWSEPATSMPSGYTAPLNTSSTAQTKTGELGASSFRDADDGTYYINPSGDSIISGKITTDYSVQESDSSGIIPTKGYVESLVGQKIAGDTPAAKLYFVQGVTNPACPSGTTIVGKHWMAKTCSVGGYNITFSGGWYGANDSPTESTAYNYYCAPDYYDAVMCAGPDPANMLFALEHNITDCTNAGGTVETVDSGVKVCKFHYSYLSGNCRQYSMCAGCNYLCNGDECSCPTGWKSYKNWSTTSHVQSIVLLMVEDIQI